MAGVRQNRHPLTPQPRWLAFEATLLQAQLRLLLVVNLC
jgi:hypothetical protein